MASKNAANPNVLVIISDDQGPWALACAGNSEILTPSLDALAANGARFSNFFCTSPVCSPARASIMTGRMPSQHGVHEQAVPAPGAFDAIDFIAGMLTYTERLSMEDYRGGLSGKWHLGASAHPKPGFDHWFALVGGMSNYRHAPMFRDGELTREDRYITDVIADDALDFLRRSVLDDRPFCLNVAFTAPHSPWVNQHPQQYLDLYKDCDFESCPQEPPHPWGQSSLHPDMRQAVTDPRGSLQGYFAAVTAMDAAVGRLMGELESLDLRRSTLVIFLSDNGFNCGHHGIWGKGNATFPQNVYDESVKVPSIISMAGLIPAGRVIEDLASAYDLFPTIMDFCGLPTDAPSGFVPPGQSLRGLLTGHTTPTRDFVVVFSEYGPVRMIRTSSWKFVRRYPYGPDELYNLVDDPHESRNLVDAHDHQRIVKELRLEMEAWFETHSIRWADGSRSPITGAGQRDRPGSMGSTADPFFQPASQGLHRVDFRYSPVRDNGAV